MKRLWNDKLIAGMLILILFNFYGSFVGGNLLESVIDFLFYFFPGFLLLLLLRPILKKIDNTKATIGAVVYSAFVGVLTMVLTNSPASIYAVILLGCFTHRMLRYGTLLRGDGRIG